MSQQAQINKIKEDLNSLLKSLAQNSEVKIEFNGDLKNNFFHLNKKIVVKNNFILPEIKTDDNFINHSRASLDLALSYFLFHDFQQNIFTEEQEFVEDFEKIRLIKKLENLYQGCVKNILQKIEEDIFFGSENLSLLLLAHLFDQKILTKTKNAAQNLQKKFPKNILAQIKILAQNIDDQKKFTKEAQLLFSMLRDLEKQENSAEDNQENNQKNSSENKKQQDEFENFGAENAGADERGFDENSSEESGVKAQEKMFEEFVENEDGKIEEKSFRVKSEASQDYDKISYINAYKIYSAQFDEVIFPQKLIAKKDLENLYHQLDLKLKNLADISRKISLKLQKKLLSKKSANAQFNANRGVINRKKLTQIILNPQNEDIWINQINHQYQNSALTILLDNSGSMRGMPIVMSAMACKIIAEILEKFGVKVEIIGFTTVDWKGGKVRRKWEIEGRPANPGRLSELRHIIYKSFNQNLKKSKINLGLMLREGILKENIDGEALLFARSRLMQQNEERKIMMVISDGTPIDDSTLAFNDADILSNHLNFVINKIEKSKKIEIIGIGIGHDTANFYRNSIAIKELEDLGDVMINKLCEIL